MRKERFCNQGFSLIEVFIVLAIGAIMVLIPVKMLTRGDERTMLGHHVGELTGELLRMRSDAARMNRSCQLTIDDENNNFYTAVTSFFDITTNQWVTDTHRPVLDLNRSNLQQIDEIIDGAPEAATFPIRLGFNSQGLQINEDGIPIIAARRFVFSNEKTVTGDQVTLHILPFGGIRVTDNFDH